MNIMGWFVGAAYMPPVAAIPANRPNGKAARDASMRPLHSYPKKGFFTKNAAPRAAYLIETLNSPLLTLKKDAVSNETASFSCVSWAGRIWRAAP